ncbi:MAG: aldo/keto reductase [Chloroflexi bacterium AL-W]|nr:aldo/keto reductase [Chloroflexi bacterium AL-N1]NOK70845.1 aldo/keto reductase [Chloroflexi bacterium AL-N10]NOK78405.1 aldo/keto reductase [Chloroflexi bacterium AL-N5]NOK85386.1 aldo/keto reductase [Chloroflexi bacterium AL-W]NOK92662.1 aldo/keto reductase [Chloroflexi bacterium AL-N15]
MVEVVKQIGQTDLHVAPLGIGTWQWGDTQFWGYGKGYDVDDVITAFWSSINAGITFFDTAEVYGSGRSERFLGKLACSTETKVVVATKFAPLPWRLSAQDIHRAIDASLQRLGVQQIDLYQIHWPFTLMNIPTLMNALADAAAAGKIHAIGVSNFNAAQLKQAHEVLNRCGVTLASNQVQYSLLARAPEVNGVRDTCRELGITLIAYSPLAMGLLTGKYKMNVMPSGARRYTPRFQTKHLEVVEPVLNLLRDIGSGHGNKTPAQVALNWLIQQDVLPIPGAKNARQAQQNAGALGWTLTEAEIQTLDETTAPWQRPSSVSR